MKDFEDDLLDETDNRKPTAEERTAIVNSLRGAASVPGKTPPTDEEWREERTNHLVEKYK